MIMMEDQQFGGLVHQLSLFGINVRVVGTETMAVVEEWERITELAIACLIK
ncbi:MAG: hypothetical protein OSA98_17565 [Rubripirellula sp.]|nr:hypothetical protein [Rubripirellula sp.]